MNRPAARSLHVFGLYLLGAGLGLMLAPALLLAPLGLPAPADVWGRVAGLVVTVLGIYDVVAARAGLMPLVRASVPVRGGVAALLSLAVVIGLAPPPLLVFAAVDALGALWTWHALQQHGAGSTAPTTA
ncbi:MAG: hypothetical protein U1F56_17535 [Rubrivivax sp.]